MPQVEYVGSEPCLKGPVIAHIGGMYTYALRILFCSFLALTLSACGNSKFDKSEGQRTFVHSASPQEASEPSDSYRIRLRGQNFEPVRERNKTFQGLAPTDLSKSIRSTTLEDNTLTIKISDKLITFQIDYEENLRFTELDETGEYSITGSCIDYSCSKAYFKLEKLSSKEVAEVQYVRTYEYLTADSKTNIPNVSRKLLQDAIKYRLPIARHSIRINESRDLDKLVIEEPKVDLGEDNYDENGTVVITNPEETDGPKVITGPIATNPNTRTEKRIELEADGVITVTVNPDKKDKPETQTVVSQEVELRLTPNPYDVYAELELPENFFPSGYQVRPTDPTNLQDNLAFTPIEDQDAFEPAQRIAAIAKAFVDQNIQVYQHACNFYVRAVMALAGYTEGGVERSNDFHKIFRRNSQGLRDWSMLSYTSPTEANKTKLDTDLNNLVELHGIVYQVDRSNLSTSNGRERHGHTAIIVKEGSDIVVYESNWNRHGPRRTVTDPKRLMSNNRPIVNLHHYPGVIRAQSN